MTTAAEKSQTDRRWQSCNQDCTVGLFEEDTGPRPIECLSGHDVVELLGHPSLVLGQPAEIGEVGLELLELRLTPRRFDVAAP